MRTQSAPHGRAGARGHRPTPAECTMHLGAPVVPEEYMMKRGWLNGSCSNSSWGAGSPLPVARKSSRNTLWGHAGGPTVNAPDAGRVREPAGTTAPGCGGHEPGAEPSHGTAEKPTPKFTASRGEPNRVNGHKGHAAARAPWAGPGPAAGRPKVLQVPLPLPVVRERRPGGLGALLVTGAHALLPSAANRLLAGPGLRRPKGGPGQGGLNRDAPPAGRGDEADGRFESFSRV